MSLLPYKYAAEKFGTARRHLMAPHPQGEADSFVAAFLECTLGLQDIEATELDDEARACVSIVARCLDKTGVDDPQGRGVWLVLVERLSVEEQAAFASAVDTLADWFRDRARGPD
jgi:hypothetical protein